MERSMPSLQPYAKFIDENPNSSRYSDRLPPKDKESLKSLLQGLHASGANRETMLTHSRILIDRPITFAQLDALRKEFGLNRYKKRPTQHTIESSGDHRSKDLAKVPTTASAAEAVVNVEVKSVTEEPEVSYSDTASDNSPLPPVLNDKESKALLMASTDHNVSRQDEISTKSFAQDGVNKRVQPAGTTSDTSLQPQGGHDVCLNKRDTLIIDGMITSLSGLSTAEAAVEDQTLSETRPKGPMVLSGSFSSPPPKVPEQFQISLEILHPWLLSDIYHFSCSPQPYSPSESVFELYSRATISQVGVVPDETVARLNNVATVLHSSRAFDQAFDVYFIIYCHFRESRSDTEPPHPQMVLGAINCARTAQTTLQITVANKIILYVRKRLEEFYGASILQHTQTGKCLDALHNLPSGISISNLEHLQNEYYEDVAYWMASAFILSRDGLAGQPKAAPDYFMAVWKGQVLQHFYICDVTRQIIVDGLHRVHSYIRKNSHWLDHLLGKHGIPSDKIDLLAAQALSCWILEEHARDGTLSSTRLDSFHVYKNHDGLPCDFNGQISIIIPFILVDWIQKFEVPILSLLKRTLRPGHTKILLRAVEHIQSSISSSTSKYEEFINLYLNHMASPLTQRLNPDTKFYADRLRDLAAGIAGVLPIQEVLAAVPIEQVQHGIKIPQTISEEEEEIRLEAFRTSTSGLSTIAASYRSSNSSGYRSFTKFASHVRDSIASSVDTQQTNSSGQRTSRSSLRFSRVTGYPSNPSSRRQSVQTFSSDVTMSG